MSCQPYNLNPSAERHAADEVMPLMMPSTGVPMDPSTQSLQPGNSKLNPDAHPFFALSACATNFCPQKWHHATPACTSFDQNVRFQTRTSNPTVPLSPDRPSNTVPLIRMDPPPLGSVRRRAKAQELFSVPLRLIRSTSMARKLERANHFHHHHHHHHYPQQQHCLNQRKRFMELTISDQPTPSPRTSLTGLTKRHPASGNGKRSQDVCVCYYLSPNAVLMQ